MNTIVLILLLAALMPLAAKLPVVIAMHRAGGYNNKLPRVQQQQLDQFGLRATAAHYNSFEALTYFAPALLAALATNVPVESVIGYAWAFIVFRVLYVIFYLIDQDKLRSLVWVAGLIASVMIYVEVYQAL